MYYLDVAKADAEKWDRIYREQDAGVPSPSHHLETFSRWLPKNGRALDLAGGSGRHALWMAQRGLTVTLCDISTVALQLADVRAQAAVLPLQTLCVDLESEPLPEGPWDVILSLHYLHRPLFAQFAQRLSPAGVLCFVQPTRSNLSRHPRPSARFLLDDGELPSLVEGLDLVYYAEEWNRDHHEACVVARRPV